jgi:hypothetical protein
MNGDPHSHCGVGHELAPCRGWLWHALVSEMLDKGWSVEKTREAAKRVKDPVLA